MAIRHYISGRDFGEPRGWQDLEITIDWINKKESGTINVSDLAFVERANEYLQSRILDGLLGGVGIFEGEPYKITVGDETDPEFIFDGFLDFTQDITVLGGEEIICALKTTKGDDWLNDVADGFSMASLYQLGIIKASDFVKVPYVINFVPDNTQIVVLGMAIFMMSKELAENVLALAQVIADVTNASIPVLGVSVGLGAGVVTAWDFGDWAMVAIKALARLAYIIAIAIAIVKLIDQIFEQFLPEKRFHLGMTYRRMFERSCEHLGMQFYSDIAELDSVHLPVKSKKGGSKGETGFPTIDEPISGFGDLIRTMKLMFNADYKIYNNTFYFQRRDKFALPVSYKMPSYFVDQQRKLDPHGFNTDEMVGNYTIIYLYDVQDQNTLDNSEGRVFQAITSPITTKNKDFTMIKGLTQIQIPFSLGLEKTNLTTVEEIAKVLANIVDGLTGIFGGGTDYSSKINNRIGSLLLSSHSTTIGKIIKMSGSKLATNQRTVLSAKILFDKYHLINSFAEYLGEHNQFWKYKAQPVTMPISDFKLLLNNNQATDDFGQQYEIERVIYNPEKTTATIDYRVKRKYTNNLKLNFVE